jgi:hypothetical protein
LNPIFAAAVEAQDLCRAKGWSYYFIGALAVQRWGEPRLTQDVDLTVVAGFGGEEVYVDAWLSRFSGRRVDAREFALRHRVVLVRSEAGVPIDVALGAVPFEERAAARASDFAIHAGVALRTCSAEDLVVLKAFAGRDKDWLDIDGIALRQAGRLDHALIWTELTPRLALTGTPEAAGRLRTLLEGRGS